MIQNLDELPNPAKYFDYQHVSSTRGCPGKCTFCGSPQFWGYKVRFHSPEYFVEQLELLYRKGISFFYFSDDTFMIKKGSVIEICRKIIEKDLKITWVAISRVNFVSEDILYWMRKAGCTQISYGVESGSEKIRNHILNKNIKTDQIKKAFALSTKYGILARAYFIYGSPGESWATIEETTNLIREIKPLNIIFYIHDIFPGTALYSDFKKRAKAEDDIWLKRIEDIMYFETDPHLTQELILAFGEKLRGEYYKNLPGFVDSIELTDKKEFFKTNLDKDIERNHIKERIQAIKDEKITHIKKCWIPTRADQYFHSLKTPSNKFPSIPMSSDIVASFTQRIFSHSSLLNRTFYNLVRP